MTTRKMIEDPRIAQVAKIVHDEMLAEIGRLVAEGEEFFHARECVMAAHGPSIAKTYGAEVARRALEGVTAVGPRDLPPEVIAAQDRVMADAVLEAANFLHGGEHYWSPLQIWKRENERHLDAALTASILMFVFSPLVGVFAVLATFDLSVWKSATLWSALAGAALFLVRAVLDAVAGSSPKQRGNPTPDEIEAQRETIRARQREEYLLRLAAEEEAERQAEAEQKRERGDREATVRLARDAEIDAWQERRRLGTQLPHDPIYWPSSRRPRAPRRSRKF